MANLNTVIRIFLRIFSYMTRYARWEGGLQNRHNDSYFGKWGEVVKSLLKQCHMICKQLLVRFYSIKFILDINLTFNLLFSNLYTQLHFNNNVVIIDLLHDNYIAQLYLNWHETKEDCDRHSKKWIKTNSCVAAFEANA